jgi:hypothetical protein
MCVHVHTYTYTYSTFALFIHPLADIHILLDFCDNAEMNRGGGQVSLEGTNFTSFEYIPRQGLEIV